MDHLIGNERAKRYLKRLLDSGYAGHTLLFSGPEGVGKFSYAKALCTGLLGPLRKTDYHPDLHIYRPQGKSGMHSMESMRALMLEVALRPSEGRWKAFIIDDAERMLPTSSNALLKTFEEPPDDTVIVLVTSHPERLLPTIVSRCRKLTFEPVPSRIKKGGDDVVRKLLLSSLAKNELVKPMRALQVATELAEVIEKEQKEFGDALRAEIDRDLPASVRDAFEQEVEGAVSTAYFGKVDRLLHDYLGWHRDLWLLESGGPRTALFHADYEWELDSYEGEREPLPALEARISDARTLTLRHGPLALALEALFTGER